MMENNYDIPAIENAYERIRSKKVFKRSSQQERILRFLIDEAFAGRDVTEHSIGIELLKDKYTGDQNDSKIRVYVFYLRKKLAEYYSGEGSGEEVIFHIEKGQYNLSFQHPTVDVVETQKTKYFRIELPKRVVGWGAVFLLLLALAGVGYLKLYQPASLWKPFFRDHTICIVADHYMVADNSKAGVRCYSTFRDVQDELDVARLNDDVQGLDLVAANFTMTTKMAPFGVHYLNRWFGENHHTFDLQLESDTQFADYLNSNVIYIGQFKNMQNSQKFFLRKSEVFATVENGFSFRKGGEVVQYLGSHCEGENLEYAMVSYQKMDNGSCNLFFVSNHDIGVMSTIKMFTSKHLLKAFVQKLPSVDSEFYALFRVSGFHRTEVSCELVQLEIVD